MLTPQEVEEARKKIGINTSNPSTPVASNLISRIQSKNQTLGQDIKEDITGIGKEVISGIKKRGENIQDIKEKVTEGKTGIGGGTFQTLGEYAGSIEDVVGAGVKGLAKLVLSPKGEQKAKEIIGTLGAKAMENEQVQKAVKWYDSLPEETQNNIDATGNFVALASEFIGIGAGAKGVKTGVKATKEAIQEGAEKVAKTTGELVQTTKKIGGEVIPSAERIVNYQVTRALDLTADDVKNISKSTGNEVGEFLADKNLIAGNKDETAKMVKDFYDTSYKTVRDEIGKVTKTYSPYNVPRYTESLKAIKKQIDGVTGLENVSVEVDNLLQKSKNQITLNDVQRVKELLDDNFNLYKVTGDVKEGATKEGLANLRSELKGFIEKEVKDNTGADIKALNNDVATSRSIADAIETRSTRGLTSSNLKIGDLGVFGIASTIGSPFLGVAAVAAKKILESSAIRLKIARYLDKISDARKLKIKNALIKGEIPKEITQIVEGQSSLPPKTNIKKSKSQKISIK